MFWLDAHLPTAQEGKSVRCRSVTVWNEFRHEKEDEDDRRDLPGRHPRGDRRRADGRRRLRGPHRDARRAGARPDRRRSSPRPMSSLWWGHKAHARRRGRDRRARPAPGAGRDGPGRPPLRPPLQDLQEADGHDLQPEVARGDEKERLWVVAPGHPIVDGHRRVHRAAAARRCTASSSTSRSRTTLVFVSAGSPAARSSAAAAATSAARGKIFYFRPGHETYPDLPQPGGPAGDRQRRPLGRPGRRPGARIRAGRSERAAGTVAGSSDGAVTSETDFATPSEILHCVQDDEGRGCHCERPRRLSF